MKKLNTEMDVWSLDEEARKKAARNAHTPKNILIVLSDTYGRDVLENPNCPLEVLYKYKDDSYYFERSLVAEHPHCPADILKQLSKDEHELVRIAVVKNPNCPNDVLLDLSENDTDRHVIDYIAFRKLLSPDILINLSKRKGFNIIGHILDHKNCPTEALINTVKNSDYFSSDFCDELLNNPNCNADVLKAIVESDHIDLKIQFTKNPKCTIEFLKELANDNNPDVRCEVAKNPKCTVDILKMLSEDFTSPVRAAVASRSDCPIEILKKLSTFDSADVKRNLYNNPASTSVVKYNCLSAVYPKIEDGISKELASLYEMGVKTNNIEPYARAYYYLFFNMYLNNKSHYTFKENQYCEEVKKDINKKIMNENFPEDVLYYLYNHIYSYSILSSEAKEKIVRIGKKAEVIDKNNNVFSSRIQRDLLNAFEKGKEESKDTNIYKLINKINLQSSNGKEDKLRTDISNSQYVGYKMEIKCNASSYLEEKAKDGTITFGYYPQDKVAPYEKAMLDLLWENNSIKESNKTYTLNTINGKKDYIEYTVNDRRFIRYNDDWIEVSPIEWYYDKNTSTMTTKKELIGGFTFSKQKMIDQFFKDVISDYSYEINDEYNKFKKIDTEKRTIDSIKLEEQKKKTENERKVKEENLVIKQLNLMLELEKVNEELSTLREEEYYPSYSKLHMDMDSLLQQIEDHYEFNSSFIPYLKYIDLSLIKSDRLKVSGIDFSNTNINIDPQLVYNRDLSNSIFDDNNFTFKSFKGCNLSGTDISKERDSVDYEEAIINDETMLPVKKDKSLK